MNSNTAIVLIALMLLGSCVGFDHNQRQAQIAEMKVCMDHGCEYSKTWVGTCDCPTD